MWFPPKSNNREGHCRSGGGRRGERIGTRSDVILTEDVSNNNNRVSLDFIGYLVS